MTLNVNLTETDFQEWNAYSRKTLRSKEKTRRVAWRPNVHFLLGNAVCASIVATILSFCYVRSPQQWWLNFVCAYLGSILTQVIREQRRPREMTAEQRQMIGVWQHTVSTNGIWSRHAGKDTHFTVHDIDQVRTTATQTILLLETGAAILIPHRDVAPDQYESFMQALADLCTPVPTATTSTANYPQTQVQFRPTQEQEHFVQRRH